MNLEKLHDDRIPCSDGFPGFKARLTFPQEHENTNWSKVRKKLD